MTNGGIIEGNPRDILAFSDLSRATSYAGQHSNTAHASTLCLTAKGRMAWSGGIRMGDRNHGNPYAEKEARLRSQHYFTLLSARGLMRGKKGNAAALLLAGDHYLPSRNRIKAGHYFFGGGETRMQCEASNGSGGLLLVRHPAPN